jgi:hypothetical protein
VGTMRIFIESQTVPFQCGATPRGAADEIQYPACLWNEEQTNPGN